MGGRIACLQCGRLGRPGKTRCPSCRRAVTRKLDHRFEQRQVLATAPGRLSLKGWDCVEKREVFIRVALPGAAPHVPAALALEARILKALQDDETMGFPKPCPWGGSTKPGRNTPSRSTSTAQPSTERCAASTPPTRSRGISRPCRYWAASMRPAWSTRACLQGVSASPSRAGWS